MNMATYPIKVLKDESGVPFVPLVSSTGVTNSDGTTLEENLKAKLEKENIIAGDNIVLTKDGNNITITGTASGAANVVINNLTTTEAKQGVLDAYQGYVLNTKINNMQTTLEGGIPKVINNCTTVDTVNALSAYQGYLLNNKFNNYLPLSGGVLTGHLYLNGIQGSSTSSSTSIVFGNTGTQYGVIRANIGGDVVISNSLNNNDLSVVYSSGQKSFRPDVTGVLSLGTSSQKWSTVYADSFSGNATTASKLQTGRTLTIGTGSKTFDGSQNISWSLDDISARGYYRRVVDLTSLNADTYYPVVGGYMPADGMQYIKLAVQLNSGSKPSWSTHGSGFTCNIEVLAIAGGWGTTGAQTVVLNDTYNWSSVRPAAYYQMTNASRPVFLCRGGGKYILYSNYSNEWTLHTSSATYSEQTVSPTTTVPSTSFSRSTIKANLEASTISTDGFSCNQITKGGAQVPATFVQSSTPSAKHTGDIWFVT